MCTRSKLKYLLIELIHSALFSQPQHLSYWPAPSSIQRGLEWTQLLKRLIVCLIVCSLLVIKFSHFSLFHPSLFIQYSTEECSTVQLFIYKIIAVMIDIDTS